MGDAELEGLSHAALIAVVRAVQTQVTALEAEVAPLRGGGPPAKTASNSSVPASKGWNARRPEPAAGSARPKRGPTLAHAGVSRRRVPPAQVDVVLPCRPVACAGCGADLPRRGARWSGVVR